MAEGIRDIGHQQHPFVFTGLANFKDLCMSQSAPRFSWSMGGGGRCVLSGSTGHWVFISVVSLSFGRTYMCPVCAASVWGGSFPFRCLCSDVKAILAKPSSSVGGKMEQLIPSAEKHRSWNQDCAWELTLNVKAYWGSQLFFGFLGLILEFLQPVTFCEASPWCVVCNCSTRT